MSDAPQRFGQGEFLIRSQLSFSALAEKDVATGWVDRFAPVGAIWVCSACGNTSHDLYGGPTASAAWDQNCMTNAVLSDESSLPVAQVQKGGAPMAIEAKTAQN